MTEKYKIRKKKNGLAKNQKWQSMLIIFLGVGLACFYGHHISSLHALWELGDEAGYLWNAAYFTGTDWDSIAGLYAYYGYGYSVLLTPLFWVTNNGIQLIKGAYVINVLCVLGMYFVLVKLLKEVSKKQNSLFVPIVACVSCLTPYIASNTLKVLCEVFLSFWYTLLVLLLYLALKTEKKRYTVLLGVCGAYIFFIHTRAMIAVGTMGLVLLLDIVKRKKKHAGQVVFLLLVALGTFAALYFVKLRIVDYMSKAMLGVNGIAKVGNIVTVNTLLDAAKWFHPINFLGNLSARLLYMICATGAVLTPGFLCMGRRVFAFLKCRDCDDRQRAISGILILVMGTYIFTVLALVYSGYGDDLRYAMYGRYYEYMLPVILSFCIYFFVQDSEKLKEKELLICLIFTMGIGIVTRIWCASYLPNKSISIDTNRLAALSKAITMNEQLESLLEFLVLICAAYLFCYLVIYKKKYAKWIILLMVFVPIWMNDTICLNEIHAIHDRSIGDTEIAEYLIDHADSQKVYMMDDNSFRIPFLYSKMQIYLKDRKMYIISPEQNESIEEGSYVIVYSSTQLKESVLSEYCLLMQGPVFLLYQK